MKFFPRSKDLTAAMNTSRRVVIAEKKEECLDKKVKAKAGWELIRSLAPTTNRTWDDGFGACCISYTT